MIGATINLAELLDRLGYTDTERFQLCSKGAGQPFAATVHKYGEALAIEQQRRQSGDRKDWWVGVNPVTEVDNGRPAAADVTRLAGLWVDLDIKPGGCPTWEIAERVQTELEAMLGERIVAVTRSGHGLQPIWAIGDAFIAGEDAPAVCEGHWNIERPHARALLRRWGRLVATVAERFGARVDAVFDLPRILRVPNSVNHKAQPVPVVTIAGPGAPLTVERILEVLDEFGIEDRREDHDDPGALVCAPAEWAWARVTCGYAELTMRGWATDRPDRDRHGWMVNQSTRIAAMHRKGCLTASDHRRAVELATNRFRALLAIPGADAKPREPERGEIHDALAWGQSRAASMSDARLDEELGGHPHKPLLAAPTKGTSDAPIRDLPDSRNARLDAPQRSARGSVDGLAAAVPAGHAAQRLTLRELVAQAEASEAATVAPPAEPETPEQAEFRLQVEQQRLRLWVSDEARKLEQQRKAGNVEIPRPTRGSAFLAVPDEPAQYRIAGLLPLGGRVVVSAQFKSGKSVMMGNLLRSLADGDPFLGCFTVTPVEGRIVLIDDELDERTLRRWLREQGIHNLDRFEVISLRGRVSTFDITNDVIRAEWARNLREADCAFLIFDCLRPVLDALGLSEDKESGGFLVALDALARDAQIAEMAVVHHMGHASERSRGDSRLRDWPDAEWKIVRENQGEDDPSAPRYFSAFGRDVDIREGLLKLEGRRLTFTAGEARKKGRGGEPERIPVEPAVEDILGHAADPMSKRQLELALMQEGHAQQPIRDAVARLIDAGLIKVKPRGRALLCEWNEGGEQHA